MVNSIVNGAILLLLKITTNISLLFPSAVVLLKMMVVNGTRKNQQSLSFLKKNGLNTPETFLYVEDALQALESGNIVFPVIIKPRWGMGSIAVFEADNESELILFYKKVRKEIKKTNLKYESEKDYEHSVLIQEKLSGQEYNLDVINDLEGKYQNTIVKKKFAMRAGETDCAETVNSVALKEIGQALSEKMHHIADLDVDVFCQGDTVYVLEMNARFGGGYPFSHMAGVNLPLAIVKWLQADVVESNLLQEEFNVIACKDIRLKNMTNI